MPNGEGFTDSGECQASRVSASRRTDLSPLARLLGAGGISRMELGARSGVHLHAISKLVNDSEAVFRLPLSTIVRVAVAMGCSVVELLPSLGKRPRTGLLWERGVFRRKRAEPLDERL
jgi:hypothetical protein